eukprot:gene16683-8125_t
MRRRSTFLNVLDNGKERQYTEDEKRFLRKLHFVSTISPTREEPSKMKVWGIAFKGPDKKFVIDPSGRLNYYWHMWLAIMFMYSTNIITLRAAFSEIHKLHLAVWLAIDYLLDVFNVLDIFMHTRLAYMDEGILECNIKKIQRRYMRSYSFALDMIAVLPIDLCFPTATFQPALRLNRLFKIHRLLKFIEKAESSTTYPNTLRVSILVIFMFTVIHLNACLYFKVSEAIGFGSDEWVYPGVLGMTKLNETYASLTRQYVQCFYWSTFTLTTIGELTKPQTTLEFSFVILDFLLGILLFASVVGYLGNVVQNTQVARSHFQQRLDAIKAYMQHHRLPYGIKKRVIHWFDYVWSNNKHQSSDEVLSCLPKKLQAEIAIHVHLDTLRKCNMLQDCDTGFLYELVLRLRIQLFLPGDYICRKGDVGHEMYIIHRGKVEVVSADGCAVYATLEPGFYFGEISLLNIGPFGNRRTSNVRSVGFSELFVITKQDLNNILAEYPETKDKIISLANERLARDGKTKEETVSGFSTPQRSRRPSAIAEQAPSSPSKQGSGEEKFSDRLDQLENHIYMKTRLDQLRQEDRLSRMESAINMLLEEKE